jgi:hypothetical protein
LLITHADYISVFRPYIPRLEQSANAAHKKTLIAPHGNEKNVIMANLARRRHLRQPRYRRLNQTLGKMHLKQSSKHMTRKFDLLCCINWLNIE